MPRDASELARSLAREAEAVCRHYLCNGRRQGRYWVVGNNKNEPGRSLFVRLSQSPKGPAGKWTDAATAEHGDLLDIIRTSCGLVDFRDVVAEAQRFLNMPRTDHRPATLPDRRLRRGRSVEAARRLFAMSQPIDRTIAQVYLRQRGIHPVHDCGALRFFERCYYRPNDDSPIQVWPAMIARVTDLNDRITGVQRTWLHPSGRGKAPLDTPRRALGDLLGHAVRFGSVDDVIAAGEGIETMLSLRCVLPTMPMAAALSANHLAAMLFSPSLRRLYVAHDADAAGRQAAMTLVNRAEAAGIETLTLSPRFDDFNADLCRLGAKAFRATLYERLAPQDVVRFLPLITTGVD